MVDVFTKRKRSQVMSRIRSQGNLDTEVCLARLLRRGAIRGWRRHLKIFGRPDFTFRVQRVVVFVDGCFWHYCPKCGNLPQNNRSFWRKKLLGNVRRDKLVTSTLKQAGWKVVRVWEHEMASPEKVISKIRRALIA